MLFFFQQAIRKLQSIISFLEICVLALFLNKTAHERAFSIMQGSKERSSEVKRNWILGRDQIFFDRTTTLVRQHKRLDKVNR